MNRTAVESDLRIKNINLEVSSRPAAQYEKEAFRILVKRIY